MWCDNVIVSFCGAVAVLASVYLYRDGELVNGVRSTGPVWIHQLNFRWLNLANRDPNGLGKRPPKV